MATTTHRNAKLAYYISSKYFYTQEEHLGFRGRGETGLGFKTTLLFSKCVLLRFPAWLAAVSQALSANTFVSTKK